jgi:hypothetical protein
MKFGASLRARISALAADSRDGEVTRPWWLTVCVIVARVIPSSLVHFRVVAITRTRSIPTFQARIGVRYRRLKPDDLPITVEPGNGRPDALNTRAMRDFRLGDEVFVAEHNEKIVAYIMLAHGRHYIPEVRFHLPLRPDEACTSRSYVDPDFRRYSGVYPGLASFLYSEVSRDSVRALLGYAVILNRYSIRVHRRLGYEQVGWVALLQVPFGSLQVSCLSFDGGRLRWRLLPRTDQRDDTPPAADVLRAHQAPTAELTEK